MLEGANKLKSDIKEKIDCKVVPVVNNKRHRSLPNKVKDHEKSQNQDEQIELKHQSLSNKTKTKSKNTDEPRRSKRVRLDKQSVGLYEFETIKDYQGKDLIVSKLVGVKNRASSSNRSRSPSQDTKLSVAKKVKKDNEETSKKEIVNNKENRDDLKLFSFNRDLKKNDFKRVSDGVTIHMRNEEEDEGILCIDPLMKCRTQRHTCDVFYVVRNGQCSFLINGTETILGEAEVVKIPKNTKYKCGNQLSTENAYLHFHFL